MYIVYSTFIAQSCALLHNSKLFHLKFFPQALVLPQAIATPTGGIILDMFERLRCDIGLGYIILFLVTSVYFVLSGIFVFNIKKAK